MLERVVFLGLSFFFNHERLHEQGVKGVGSRSREQTVSTIITLVAHEQGLGTDWTRMRWLLSSLSAACEGGPRAPAA